MIEAHDLVKRYGSTMAVNDLSFSIRPGMVTGFLGPATPASPLLVATSYANAASPPWPEEGPLTRLSRGSGAARKRFMRLGSGQGAR
jgi:ABC-type phosphonate transport system ATPase subunit